MALTRPSRRTVLTVLGVLVLSALLDLLFGAVRFVGGDDRVEWRALETVSLPEPAERGETSVEAAIAARRSRREYGDQPLTLDQLGQLLWAAQGVTDDSTGHRATPSAGALYPLELYVVVGPPGVEELETGIYHYHPRTHDLVLGSRADVQSELAAVSIDQGFVESAAVDVVVCAVDDRTTGKYGERGALRYVPMEAGHAAQNVYLQAESLGLSTVCIGAFDDGQLLDVVGVSDGQRPLYLVPIGGRPR